MANPPVGHTDIAEFYAAFKHESQLTSRLTSGLYCLIKNGLPVYFGQSKNIHGRLGQHRRASLIDFDQVLFYELDSESDRLRAEALLIIFYLPIENRAIYLGLNGKKDKCWAIQYGNKASRTARQKSS